MTNFEYYRPQRIEEAVSVLLESGPRGAVLAGGTDIVPRLKRKQLRLDVIVDLGDIDGVRQMTPTTAGLRVGALCTAAELAASPLLRQRAPVVAHASSVVGAMQVRNMATVGGALASGLRCQFRDQAPLLRTAQGPCLRDGASLCHAHGGHSCAATQATDLPPALLAADASVCIVGPDGRRDAPISSLYTGDGLAPYTLAEGELIESVTIPWSPPTRRAVYKKLRLRKAVDRPLLGLGVAADLSSSGEILHRIDVHVSGAGPAVVTVPGLEPFFGSRLDDSVAAAIGRAVSRRVSPSPAIRIDVAWRKGMAGVQVRRAIEQLAREARQATGQAPSEVTQRGASR